MGFRRLIRIAAKGPNIHNVAATGVIVLALAAAAWAQTRAPASGHAPTADTFMVDCTMGTASIVAISAGACAVDAEHDEGQGGDPSQDTDGPNGQPAGNSIFDDPNTNSTSTCGQGSSQQVANCYPSPNGPASGPPREGGGGTATSGGVSSSTWLTACTKEFASAEAACDKHPNPQACLTQAKSADKACIMAASNNAAQHGDRLPPDPSTASAALPRPVLSRVDCTAVHSRNTQYCSSVNPALKATCMSKAAVADNLCSAAARG